MKWTDEAEAAIRKVPFFVRKRVKARVEKEAAEAGRPRVTIDDVNATQKRYLSGMESEMRGYQLDSCFGPSGCPNRAVDDSSLVGRLRDLLESEDLLGFLRKTVSGKLRFHHEFRVALADCPNACSQVQIKDIGILGACTPTVTDADCSECGACEEACPDGAVSMAAGETAPVLDMRRCQHCGKCVAVCPTGTLAEGERGYRIQVGGKLGRHPRLALPIPGVYSEDQVMVIVRDCIAFYKRRSVNGARFAEIIEEGHIRTYLETDVFPQ